MGRGEVPFLLGAERREGEIEDARSSSRFHARSDFLSFLRRALFSRTHLDFV